MDESTRRAASHRDRIEYIKDLTNEAVELEADRRARDLPIIMHINGMEVEVTDQWTVGEEIHVDSAVPIIGDDGKAYVFREMMDLEHKIREDMLRNPETYDPEYDYLFDENELADMSQSLRGE